MDAKPATSLAARMLLILCLAVTAAGVIWQAWDMVGPRHRSMLQGWDDSFYYFWLPSVVIDHDLDFTNQLAHSDAFNAETRREALTQPPTPTGLMPDKYPPGWALGSLPFFLAAHAFSPAGSTGFEPQYLIAVWAGQLLYAGVGLWLAVRILRRYFPPPTALVAVLAVWLASPLVYYQTVRLTMSHSQSFFLGMAVFWFAQRLASNEALTRDWALLGLCAALLVVTRNVAAVYLVLPVLVIAQKLRSIRAGVWLVLGAVIPLAVQLAAWKILYGSWVFYSYGGERFDFAHLHLWAVLFSPRHGWFYWHPLLLPSLGAFLVWAHRRSAGRAWLVSLASIFLLNAAWPTWWLGSSFGHRGFEIATFFAMAGFAFALDASRSRPVLRQILGYATASAIAWNLLLLVLFLVHRIPCEESVTYGDTVRALFGWFAASR